MRAFRFMRRRGLEPPRGNCPTRPSAVWNEVGVAQRRLMRAPLGVVSALRLIPSARTVTPRAELDVLADDVAAKLELWLEEIGFRFVDPPVEGQRFFGVLNPDVWVS
jgi:hypothetical protein